VGVTSEEPCFDFMEGQDIYTSTRPGLLWAHVAPNVMKTGDYFPQAKRPRHKANYPHLVPSLDTRWRSRKVAGSIPDVVIVIFHSYMVMGSTNRN
jgi:hypothetical protein